MATEQFIIDIRTRGTGRAAKNVKQIGRNANQVRKTLAFLRAALVAVAAVRVFAVMTKSLVEFSDEMLVVKAVTNATTVEFARLRETAKGLGAATRFTAAEAAQGMAFLARAGFEVNEVISAIPATLDLAAAAQLDLGNAADIASNLMTSFGLTVADMPEIMDTLVFTANNANTTVQQLADGLKLFAPIASQLGIDLKDASAAMAVLGDAGIQASLAGTGFRRVLTRLEAPTGTMARVLKKLGIGFDEVRPSVVGIGGALARLKEANIGASISSAIFGQRAGFVAAQLLRVLGPMGDFREELERIEGTARKAAEEMEKGLGGALRLVRSALQNLLITFGDLGAEEFLNQFFRDLAESLRLLARNAGDVVAAVKVMLAGFAVAKIVSFGGAILVAGGKVIFLFKSLNVIPGAALRAAATLTIFKNALRAIPFVAILTALIALTAGFVLFRDEIKLMSNDGGTMADVFTTLIDLLGTEFTNVINALGFDFSGFGEIIKTVASRSASAIESIIAVFFGLLEVVKAVFKRIKVLFKEFLLGIEITVFAFKSIVNTVSEALGRGVVFENVRGEADKLADEIKLLNKEIEKGGSLFDNFIAGGRAFLAAREATTRVRLIAERDAAILATEEANRRAAQARIITPKEKIDTGLTLEEVLGDDDTEKTIKNLTDALRGLEASISPLIAAEQAEAEALKIINDARNEGIELQIAQVDIIRRVRREQLGANQTIGQLTEQLQVLNEAYKDNIITLEEFEHLSRQANITFLEGQRDAASGANRAFLKIIDDATDAAKFTEMAFTDAFKAIEDQVVGFAETGTFSINEFFRNIADQLIRLGTQQAIAGFGGFFTNLLGGEGGFGAGGPSGNSIAGIGGMVTSLFSGSGGGLFGFHEGGAFTVGANTAVQSLPGIDNRLVAFRARDDEEVTVTPKGTGVGAIGPTNIVFHVQTKDADSFKRSQTNLQNRLLAGIDNARRRR